MLSLKDAKVALMQIGLSQEDVDKYEVLAQPYIKLHQYLMKKLNMSSEDVENLTKTYTNNYVSKKLEEYSNTKDSDGNLKLVENISQEEYSKISGDSMNNLALENGYSKKKAQILTDNMLEITIFMTSIMSKLSIPNESK